ncbi:MAG: hypothetical protein ACI9U2_001255 [Bradymonadia bacterium]|jgi:hypothetical protein
MPLCSMPLRSMPLCSMPLRSMPLRSMLLRSMPLRSVLLCSMLLCLACGKAPPAVDAGGAIAVAPATAMAPSVPPTAPPAPPPSKPHATLFAGAAPTVPALFEGLTPGMPLLAARVLFPQLPGDQVIPAPYADLRFTVYITGEQVSRLGIATLDSAHGGAKLRAFVANQWQDGVRTKDDSGRVLTLWHAPKTGLRVMHQAEPDGSAHVFFDAFTPLSTLTDTLLPLLQAQIGRTPAEVLDAIDGAVIVEDEVKVLLPALAFGQPMIARMPFNVPGENVTGKNAADQDSAKTTVQRVLFDLSFTYKPAFKGEILTALKARLGRAKADKTKMEAFDFKGMNVEAKADRWRLTLR